MCIIAFMITLRKSADRGHFDYGWLETYHTFSFDQYRDPRWNGFRKLRVINEDYIQPDNEFPTHPHRDMEIITYLISGELSHNDSMGNGSTIYPADVQRMSAGSGVTHSEANTSKTESTHLLQIWIFPDSKGLQPEYEQKNFSEQVKLNRLCIIASADGRDGSLRIHQEATVYASILEAGNDLSYAIPPERHVYLQLISGSIAVNEQPLVAGDGAAINLENHLNIKSSEQTEFLLFDLG